MRLAPLQGGTTAPFARRQVCVPLSRDAINLLRSLPGGERARPDDCIFPSSTGTRLRNPPRVTAALQVASDTIG